MQTISVRGETLHYVRRGQGKALVLVHSLGTNAGLWSEQMQHWSRFHDVIAFDARGHGQSTNHGGVTMRDVAGDIHAALQSLGIPNAHFIGISMGGLICARLHERDPAMMLSVVIADSFTTLGEMGPKRVADLEARIAPMTMAEYGRIYAAETLLPATPRQHFDALAGSIAAVAKEHYLQTVRSIFTEDVRSCLEAMRLPALVVVGTEDKRTPPKLSEAVCATIRGARLVAIENAAHLANLDNPAGFHAAIDPFLAEQVRG